MIDSSVTLEASVATQEAIPSLINFTFDGSGFFQRREGIFTVFLIDKGRPEKLPEQTIITAF